MAVDILMIVLATATGTALSCLLACIPGLHIYNVLGLLALAFHAFVPATAAIPAVPLTGFASGMLVGYSLLNTIPSVLLAAPDESAFFMVLPGQKYLMNGRGYEGTMITLCGGIVALVALVCIGGPLAPRVLPLLHKVLRPHSHWILWCVIAFMLMSEWPMQGRLAGPGWGRFFQAWRPLIAGLFTFVLSGLLGFILFFRSPVAAEVAFQNMMPAFVGLFTMPWLLLNIGSRIAIPEQQIHAGRLPPAQVTLKGAMAGLMGGGFAAFFPAVTGGVGGFLAGHAFALRDDRQFLVSQGASKLTYYVGGYLLLFVPGLNLTRGGGAAMMRGIYVPLAVNDYTWALASIALAGCVVCLLAGPLTRGTLRLLARVGYRRLSIAALVFIVALVVAATGWRGLCVMAVSATIGLVPILYGSRRMNCLGVILLPLACSLSDVAGPIAQWLGLL